MENGVKYVLINSLSAFIGGMAVSICLMVIGIINKADRWGELITYIAIAGIVITFSYFIWRTVVLRGTRISALEAQNETLKARIISLENKNGSLDERISEIGYQSLQHGRNFVSFDKDRFLKTYELTKLKSEL